MQRYFAPAGALFVLEITTGLYDSSYNLWLTPFFFLECFERVCKFS